MRKNGKIAQKKGRRRGGRNDGKNEPTRKTSKGMKKRTGNAGERVSETDAKGEGEQ